MPVLLEQALEHREEEIFDEHGFANDSAKSASVQENAFHNRVDTILRYLVVIDVFFQSSELVELRLIDAHVRFSFQKTLLVLPGILVSKHTRLDFV